MIDLVQPLCRCCHRAELAAIIALLGAVRPAGAVAALIAPLGFVSPLQAASSQSAVSHPYSEHVEQAAIRFGIPENWIWSVMRQESGGNPRATSPVGAQGLMQIMPATWAMLSARYELGSNAYDVRANISAGAAYLRMMWDRYRDVRLMLAAYNAGPGRVDAYVARQRGLPAETIDYVARITPSLGTSGVAARAAVPSPDAQSWRSASVFIARNLDSSDILGDASTVQGARMPVGNINAPASPLSRRSNPLFFDMGSSRK